MALLRASLLLIGLFLLACVPAPKPMDATAPVAYTAAIDTVRANYAPDKRVALFAVEAVPNADAPVLRGTTNLPAAKAALLAQLTAANLPYVDSLQVLPAADLGQQTYGLVRQSVANIRSVPKHSGELATQALLGTPLRVYQREESWYLVQTPDGYISWLDSGGLQLLDSTEMATWRTSDRLVYTQEYGMAYTRPAADNDYVGDLVAGAILQKTGENGEYYQVRYPDRREGYVKKTEAQSLGDWLASRSLAPAAIFATAQQQIGRPYLWGGTSGKGMDCSGLTKTVYFRHGLVIPRDASQQVHAGVAVPTDTTLANLQAGDFLFFGTYRDDGSQRVTHVGIYLGDGRFIHAGADNGATAIQSLRRGEPDFAAHRLATLLGARRMLDGDTPLPGIVPIGSSGWYTATSAPAPPLSH